MLFRSVYANKKASLRMGLLAVAIGLCHQTLSPLWVRHFHVTGHGRSILVDFVSGLAVGLGIVLLVSAFGNNDPAECAVAEPEEERSTRSDPGARH